MKIPVILLSHNNHELFKLSFNSLKENTSHKYDLFVVDNNSTSQTHKDYLLGLEQKGEINLYLNSSNRFVLGLNTCLNSIRGLGYDYYVVCDSDFIYPPSTDDGLCWLTCLVNEMERSPYIGKLGISISLNNILDRPHLKPILERELAFRQNALNENVWVAQVDTTPAIYRKDFFFWGTFNFYPGHMTANRPCYHIGRLKNVEGIHLGWNQPEYDDTRQHVIPSSKLISFALYGGSVDSTSIKQLGLSLQLTYFLLKFFSKTYWLGFKVLQFILYLIRCRLFLTNILLFPSKK